MSEPTTNASKIGNGNLTSPSVKGTFYSGVPKRAFDITLSVMILPALLLVLAVLYFVVRLDGGTAFFGHERVGLNGKKFKCWKIRSMVPDAKERLEELLANDPEARAEWSRDRKLRNDPRITRVGKFLRKSSLDELPQIWNVLKGEMSLIGPRPVPQDELDENYGGHKWIYQSVRPGVTGLWQVSGRNDVSYDERIQMDLEYYNRLSFGLDLKILAGTVNAVFDRTGM